MPNMFSRRRGSSTNPPIDRSTSINASTAASQAFLNNSQSTTSLSSAAAAAALRSLNASPEPVGSVQTKRMIRRGSTSSNGSGAGARGGAGRPGLQRSNSNGSMTERTFRSPSPGRANGTMSPAAAAPDAPPVPALPANINQRASTSMDRQRVTSPNGSQRGSSANRTNQQPAQNPTPIQTRLTNVAETEQGEPNSPSRNFSRPMSPVPGTATTKKYTHKSGPWFTGGSAPAPIDTSSAQRGQPAVVYDPNSRSFVQTVVPPKDESPSSPVAPQPSQVYDPNTRSFVPVGETSTPPQQPENSPAPAARMSRPIPAPVNTSIQPPPRNPARLSPTTSAPRSPRAAGMLQKHPSVVREDFEAEQQAEASSSTARDTRTVRPASQMAATPAKTYTTPSGPHQRATSLDVPRTSDSVNRGRNSSTSPQRSAHFSPSPILRPGERHVPPPRDSSPAKSALKHSPASSVRTASPIAIFSPPHAAGPASETSEDTHSQDGFGSAGKKKKSVRVSFDEQPKEIEVEPVVPKPVPNFDDEDEMMKPRPALPSFGSIRRERMQAEPAEKVTEMPPERGTSSDHAIGGILQQSRNEPVPPEVTSKESAGYVSDESSDDGEIPAVASAARPEPAVVGAGRDVSGAEGGEPKVKDFAAALVEEKAEEEGLDVPAIALQPPTPGLDEEAKRGLGESEEDFRPRADQRNSMENIHVPGGWDKEEESDDKKVAGQTPAQPAPAVIESTTPAARRASTEDSAATQTVTPIVLPGSPSSPQLLDDIDEDTSDAEFSDAVEDPSDLEDNGGGFASLDAIVESPLVTPARATAPAEDVTPDSPSAKQAAKAVERNETAVAGAGNWGQATAYWSQLSREKREQLERAHLSSDDEATPPPALRKPALKKKTPTPAAGVASGATGGILKQTTQPKQGTVSTQASAAQPALRKTMRASQGPAAVEDGVHLKSSMRSGTGSMTSRPRHQQQPQPRPQSDYVQPRGALQKKNLRPTSTTGGMPSTMRGATAQPERPASSGLGNQSSPYPVLPKTSSEPAQRRNDPPQVSARLQRELTNDSDSESSFKKRRRAGSASADGRYSMRRSMRSGSIDSTPNTAVVDQRRPVSPPVPSGRNRAFSLRSLSPNGSFFGRSTQQPKSSMDAGMARTTLRNQPAATPPARTTLRSNAGPPVPAPPTTSSAPKSRFKSRFVDSDDSDDDRPARPSFRSRFADSDDEDESGAPAFIPADLRPVRGIPRKQGQDDGDSTDLEDEVEDDPRKVTRKREKMATPMVPAPGDVEKAMAAARRNLGISDKAGSEAHEGEALRKGTLRGDGEPKTLVGVAGGAGSVPASPVEVPEKKKRGFMGSLLRRNRYSSASVQQVVASPAVAVPQSPATASTTQAPPLGSPFRPSSPASPTPGKLIRRRSDQPQFRRGDSNYSTATAPVFSTPITSSPLATKKDAENWPLPPPIPTAEEDGVTRAPAPDAERPNTSDGVSTEAIKLAQEMRPDLAPRSKSGQTFGNRVRIEAGVEGTEPGERVGDGKAVYSRRTGKKKKFGALRRAFGIDD